MKNLNILQGITAALAFTAQAAAVGQFNRPGNSKFDLQHYSYNEDSGVKADAYHHILRGAQGPGMAPGPAPAWAPAPGPASWERFHRKHHAPAPAPGPQQEFGLDPYAWHPLKKPQGK